MASQRLNPIQTAIPVNLERRIRELQYSSHTGPPDDLDDNQKRWLVVGICLHSILSPALRKYVNLVVTKLFNSLKLTDKIDTQTHPGYLRKYGAANFYLNYEAINNNKTTHGYRLVLYDYKVQNAIDLSKLFLQTHMTHYSAFDESCDSSALLGIIDNIDNIPGNLQSAAKYVRSAIRNPWAHCNFTEWNPMKYNLSLQKIEDFIYLLNLNAAGERQLIEELNKWRTNGTSFLQGTTIGLELVDDIRQQIQVLMEYATIICKSSDIEFVQVQTELREMSKTLSQNDYRMSVLENTVATQGQTLLDYGSSYDVDILEIQRWKQISKDFIKTDIFADLLRFLEDNHCVLLTGVSGMGKTFTAQNIALQLCHEKGYLIVPCSNVKDITRRYKDNVRQVFFVDDLCGKYTANINEVENWKKIDRSVKLILKKKKTKVLATCRTEILKQDNVKVAFKSFQEPFYLSVKYSPADKTKIAGKYLKADNKLLSDIVIKDGFSPLMCYLYSQHDRFDVNEFLNSPYETFSDEWDELKTIDKEKFCVLLLCVLYNGSIDKDIFYEDSGKQEKRKLKEVFELCELSRDTSRSAIENKLKACVDTYFIEINKEYKVIHDKMFDFLCCYFGKQLIAPILKFGSNKLIGERVQLDSIQQLHREFTIVISSNDEGKYFDRLKTDIENGKIHCCLNNWQMKYMVYRQKFLDVFKYLSKNRKSDLINTQDDNGINSFIVSCLHGYEELVSYFISEGIDVSARNGLFTPLTAACRDGHLKTVQILLDQGSIVNQTNSDGETPLYTACSCGHYSLVKYLIEKHADINKRNKYNISCLIVASYGGHDDIVAKLISKDCDIDSYDSSWKTAIFVACEEGYTKIVKLLIEKNADIFRVDTDGRTPLHAACCLDNDEVVNILISNDADVNMLDVDFETPLHKACRKGSISIIQILLDNGADINETNRDGHTPSYLAKAENKISDEHILKALNYDEIEPAVGTYLTQFKKDTIWKQAIASTSSFIRYELTPLYEACVRGDKDTVILLIRNRADVNMKTSSGDIPLVAACQQGHGVIIQILLDEKSNVNEALCCAVEKDYDRAAKILLSKGGDLSYKGENGKSLMTLARERGSIKTIKILLKHGAKFKEIDANGKTLIYAAENKARFDLLQFISDKGLDLEIPDKDGKFPLFVSEDDIKTALISVFESGNKELSKLLVTYGYTDNLTNFNDIMLYHACRLGINEEVEMFLRNGGDIQKTYSYGYTPLKLADISGNDDLLEHLQRKECNYESIRNKIIVLNYKPGEVHVTFIGESIENVTEIQNLFPIGPERKVHHYECQRYQHLFKACMFGEGKALSFLSIPLNCFFKPTEPLMSIWFAQTPLCLAISRGHTEVVKSLLKHGVNVNLTFENTSIKEDDSLSTTIQYGYTPLFSACQRNYYEIVDMLLEKGANLNKALHDACREGYLDTVQFLLQKGADVNSIGRFGQTALYAACIGGYYTIVKLLIEQVAVIDMEVHKANKFDITCLHAAYQYGYFCIVKLLLNKGASVDTKDNFGRTLLHKASTEGKYEVVEILLEKKCDINASDMNGVTPLIACLLQTDKARPMQSDFQYQMMPANPSLGEHYIYQMQKDYPDEPADLEKKILNDNHYEVVKKLIQNGVDINKADKKERTPLSIARQIGDIKLIDILLMKK